VSYSCFSKIKTRNKFTIFIVSFAPVLTIYFNLFIEINFISSNEIWAGKVNSISNSLTDNVYKVILRFL